MIRKAAAFVSFIPSKRWEAAVGPPEHLKPLKRSIKISKVHVIMFVQFPHPLEGPYFHILSVTWVQWELPKAALLTSETGCPSWSSAIFQIKSVRLGFQLQFLTCPTIATIPYQSIKLRMQGLIRLAQSGKRFLQKYGTVKLIISWLCDQNTGCGIAASKTYFKAFKNQTV